MNDYEGEKIFEKQLMVVLLDAVGWRFPQTLLQSRPLCGCCLEESQSEPPVSQRGRRRRLPNLERKFRTDGFLSSVSNEETGSVK
jgi:hypothetical protein